VVAVIGGGISGLAAAWELSRSEAAGRSPRQVVVLEAQERLGGSIRSALFAGRQVDLGPDAFLTRRDEALSLCRELGLEHELVAPATGAAYVLVGGRLRRLPAGLALGVPTRLGPVAGSGILSPGGLARAALDLLVPPGVGVTRPSGDDGDVAVGEVVGRRLGRQVVERLADPLIGGIHAGGVEQMSAAAVFPALVAAAGRGGSLMRNLRAVAVPASSPSGGSSAPTFLTVRGGLARLVEALHRALVVRGVEIHTASPVSSLERPGRWALRTADGVTSEADAVVLTAPAPLSAGLVRPHSPLLAGLLESIDYASVTLLTLRFAAADVGTLPEGSGFLVPRRDGGLVTACTWMSSKWPELARPDDVLVRASLGRHGDDRPADLDDAALVERATAELTPAMALAGAPTEALVTRFGGAFPQYRVGHLAKVAAMEQEAARLGGLALAGSALQGVGIPACIASGRRAGRAVAGQLEATAWR
jgi:protoporphyrinogen/coproporphyrinogen III oxidase